MLLFAATAVNAQTIVKGDMNDDNNLTIADAVSVVDVILGKSPMQTISLGGDPYKVDNTLVVGTWYAPEGWSFTLNDDGTTDYPGATTYKFRPYQGTLMLYNASGRPVTTIVLNEVDASYLLAIDYATHAYTYYTKSTSLATGITLDQTSLSMNSGTTAQLSATITPAEAFATITWTSSDESVATVDANGLVTAIAVGTCTITAKTSISNKTATCSVTVEHEYVDLGLPSRTLWATCNIGASSPEDYGDYFAWGETTGYNDGNGKTYFDWSTYKLCNGRYDTLTKYCYDSSYGYNGFTDTKTELDPEDDAAYVNWGPAWRMPTIAQFEELINSSYTTTKWTTQNGVYGRLITSNTNSNSIFLPAAGWCHDSSLYSAGSGGYYWSRTLNASDPCSARDLLFESGDIYTSSDYRYFGRSVRPVRLSE